MKHPLEFFPLNLRKPLFFFFLTFALVIYGVFSFLDRRLQTPAAPLGIVSFELAGSPERAFQILVSWEEACEDCPPIQKFKPLFYAAFGLGLDYLFMPVYALALSLGLLLAGAGKADWYAKLTATLGWGAFAAALFDAAENYALWQVLTGGLSPAMTQLAAVCAVLKFSLLAVGIAAGAASAFIPGKS